MSYTKTFERFNKNLLYNWTHESSYKRLLHIQNNISNGLSTEAIT